jgi:hypothetical protein
MTNKPFRRRDDKMIVEWQRFHNYFREKSVINEHTRDHV